jgi:hypothetical protein
LFSAVYFLFSRKQRRSVSTGGALGEDAMAKAEEFVSPANLWGKPLPGATSKAPAEKEKKEKGTTGMRFATPEDYDDEDVDADVDAELEEDTVDDEDAYAEADADYEDEGSEDVRETAAKLPEDEVDEDDETEYAPEEGDAVSDEAVDSTVEADEDDDPVEAPKATKTRKGKVKDMAEKKSGADHIREEIERRQESGDSLRGVDIVAALAKKRVTVSPAQVSQLLKKAGAAPAKRGVAVAGTEERTREAARHKRKEEPAKVAPKRPVAKGPTGSTSLPMDQLKAATAFLAACDGCYDMAGDILAEHKKLRSVGAS